MKESRRLLGSGEQQNLESGVRKFGAFAFSKSAERKVKAVESRDSAVDPNVPDVFLLRFRTNVLRDLRGLRHVVERV